MWPMRSLWVTTPGPRDSLRSPENSRRCRRRLCVYINKKWGFRVQEECDRREVRVCSHASPGPCCHTPLMLVTAPISQMRKPRLGKVKGSPTGPHGCGVAVGGSHPGCRGPGPLFLTLDAVPRTVLAPGSGQSPAAVSVLRPLRQEVSRHPASLPRVTPPPPAAGLDLAVARAPVCVSSSLAWVEAGPLSHDLRVPDVSDLPGPPKGPGDVWGRHGRAPKRFFR